MTLQKNYFKTTGSELFVFFVSDCYDSISEAFERACAANRTLGHSGLPAIYRMEQVLGNWRKCPIVGHLPRSRKTKAAA